MLINFKSSVTETVTMFGDVGKELIQMMGASGRVPGALAADDVADALQKLEQATDQIKIQTHAATPAPPADNEDTAVDDDGKDKEPVISVATRAIPLISLLKRAAAANTEVMWEAG